MSLLRLAAVGAALSFSSSCLDRGVGTDGVDPSSEVLAEREPNDEPARAATLAFGVPAGGRIGRGDRDCWSLDLAQGQRATIEVFATRLDQADWNASPPSLRILAPDGVTTCLVQDSLGDSVGWGVLDPDVPAFEAATSGAHTLVVSTEDGASAGGEYLVLVQGLGVSATPEGEPAGVRGANDGLEDAELLAPGVVAGFHVDDDEDWFRVEVSAPSILSFAVLSQRNGRWAGDDDAFDPALTLLDARGRELARNDDGLFGDSLLRYSCAGGEYYLRLDECCADGAAPYFLVHEARALDDALDEAEPNDSPSRAPYVPFARVVAGTLEPHGRDVFALPCFAGDRLELWVDDRGRNERAHGTVAVELLDPNGAHARMDAGHALGVRTALIAADGTYFLAFTAAEPRATDYAFEVRLETAHFEVEPNDAAELATAFESARRIAGRIERPDDVDRFALDARAGLPVLLECFADDEFGSPGFDELDGDGSDLDPLLEVHDARGTLVARASALPRNAIGLVHGRSTVSVAFVPRASGAHTVTVRDARGGSGPSHTYVLERH